MTSQRSNKDIVVTVPAKFWFSWLCEGDLPGDPSEEREEWAFYTATPPSSAFPGQRIYVVTHGFLRGYSSGPGVACTLFENGAPKPMRGFQGWRYATWEREEVRGWEGVQEGWAGYGLPTKLANDVLALLTLRSGSQIARNALREVSLAGGIFDYDNAYSIVKSVRAR
jgi:hypothetical protein